MRFHVGQKVVCVDDDPEGHPGLFPVAGQIYTIRWVGMFFNPWFKTNKFCVHLIEINRPAGNLTRCVVPYRASRFRPVVERKTDISIFTEMLGPQRELSIATGDRRK